MLLLILSFLPGAELLVEQLGPGVTAEEKENPNIFLVGASMQRLLCGAEDLGLFKEYTDGSMRAFTYANRQNFKDFKGNDCCLVCFTVASFCRGSNQLKCQQFPI